MNWRRVLSTVTAMLAAIGLAVAWHSRYRSPYRAQISRVAVRLPRAHAGLAGTTIAFVTDTHIGPHVSAADLAPVARALRDIAPDIVLFGGDYISESPRFMTDAATVLGEMASTATYGAWGVMGNHDLANTRARVARPIAEAGIRILTNDAARVATGRGDLWIAGVDDAILGKADLAAAFRDVPPGAPVIAIWHEPDRTEEMALYGPFLMLSGHTHGGQVKIPLLGAIALPILGRRYIEGRFELGDMTLYVSRGIGMYRPPVRFNCPPELVILTLYA